MTSNKSYLIIGRVDEETANKHDCPPWEWDVVIYFNKDFAEEKARSMNKEYRAIISRLDNQEINASTTLELISEFDPGYEGCFLDADLYQVQGTENNIVQKPLEKRMAHI